MLGPGAAQETKDRIAVAIMMGFTRFSNNVVAIVFNALSLKFLEFLDILQVHYGAVQKNDANLYRIRLPQLRPFWLKH
jgi:hypothetical protein